METNEHHFDWKPIRTCPEDVEVMTKIHTSTGVRNEQSLVGRGNLFFFPYFSMYVYYRPTHWTALPGAEGGA